MITYRVADLPPVSRTLLIPLAYRAKESQRPDALLRDSRAANLIRSFDDHYDKQLGKSSMDQVAAIMRVRQFDREARFFKQASQRHRVGYRLWAQYAL